jgi:ParB family chromosome partitioning protein
MAIFSAIRMTTDGRPLDAADLAEAGPPEAVRIPIELVDPNPANPRKHLVEVDELADSIAEFSLMQPVYVRRQGERYQLLSGHRRLAAFKLLAKREPHQVRWRSIPAVIGTFDDDRSYLALITAQVHTANWQPREQAAALERLALSGLSLRRIGEQLHRDVGWVSRRLRVFADSILSGYVQSGKLAPSIAEELLPVLDTETKRKFAEQAAKEHWSQDQIKGRVRALRLDRQLGQISKVARQLVELLSSVDPRAVPIETTRDLWTLHGRIEVLARGQERRVPTVAEAEKAAGIRPEPKTRAQPKRRTKFRTDLT